MTVSNNFNLIESLLARTASSQKNISANSTASFGSQRNGDFGVKDNISISSDKLNNLSPKSSRLVSEDIEKIENGFRRTQVFETPRGGEFTRIEEQTNTAQRSKRLVVQQNESGSTTILENILDRQEDGTFRQTQRFTNEVGETSTDIQFNVSVDNASSALGLPASPTQTKSGPFESTRGTQYNVVV